MKHFLLLLLFCVPVTAVNAQSKTSTAPAFKIAYFDKDSLLAIIPEFIAANDSAQKFQAELEKQMTVMLEELQKKSDEYNKLGHKPPKEIIEQEKELYSLQQNIQAFQTVAQEKYEAYKKQLLVPVYSKVNDAARKIAKEKGYAYVLDGSKSAEIIIFANESYNIFDDMCKELGISIPKKQ